MHKQRKRRRAPGASVSHRDRRPGNNENMGVLKCQWFKESATLAAGAETYQIPHRVSCWLPIGPKYNWMAEDPPPEVAAAMGDSDPVVISNGFVIVEDELLERPYVIWRNGNGIKINGRLVWRREPVRVWAFRDNPPDVPDAAPSDHDDWDEWLYRNWDEYWRQCLEYVFAHADRPYALPSEVAPLLERLPCFRRVWVWEPEPGCAPEETYLRVEWNGGKWNGGMGWDFRCGKVPVGWVVRPVTWSRALWSLCACSFAACFLLGRSGRNHAARLSPRAGPRACPSARIRRGTARGSGGR